MVWFRLSEFTLYKILDTCRKTTNNSNLFHTKTVNLSIKFELPLFFYFYFFLEMNKSSMRFWFVVLESVIEFFWLWVQMCQMCFAGGCFCPVCVCVRERLGLMSSKL